MSAANLFHDLDEAKSHEAAAFVSASSFAAWWARVTSRTMQIEGAPGAVENGGAHFRIPASGTAVYGTASTPPRWEVVLGANGFLVGYGTARVTGADRVPRIGGVAIDVDPSLPPVEPPAVRPELAYRADGVIAVEIKARLTHGTVPAYGAPAGAAEPYYSATLAWNAWPEVKWQSDITTSTPASHPPTGTFTDIVKAAPIAKVLGGRIYRLRWNLVGMNNHFTTTLNRTRLS
jgi:hypothetical protein